MDTFWRTRNPQTGEFLCKHSTAELRQLRDHPLYRSNAWVMLSKNEISLKWAGHEELGYVKATGQNGEGCGIRQYAIHGRSRKKGKRGHQSRLPMVFYQYFFFYKTKLTFIMASRLFQLEFYWISPRSCQ